MKIATLFTLTLALGACDPAATDDGFDTSDDVAGGKEDAFSTGKFETFVGRDGRYYFHLLAGNGQKVLQSQGYVSKQGAETGIASVRTNGADAAHYQLLSAQNGQFYFNLRAANYQVIGTSELYVTQSNAQRAIAAVKGLLTPATEAAAPTIARFQVFPGLDGQYYFHLRARNGEIVLASEGYTRRTSALSGTVSVLANGADVHRYEVQDAADGQAYFVLKAANGQVIGVSETYQSRYDAERGAADVVALLQSGTIAALQ